MNDARAVKEKVDRYYRAATEDYLKYYQADWHHHMHYGFDRDLPKGGNPTEHLVRYLAGVAGLRMETGKEPGLAELRDGVPLVLDAGCGVGGSAIWLSRHARCRAVGITLVEGQARLARGFAARGPRKGPADEGRPGAFSGLAAFSSPLPVKFAVVDFTAPAFKPGTFDVVWALESFDHAPDKEDWIREMHALLKPGGRLVLADGFRAERAFTPAEKRDYDGFLSGWAVPHLCTVREVEAWGKQAGFEVEHAEDISRDVLPHSLAIFRFGLLFIPWRWALRKLGLTSDEKLGNAYATYYQYLTLKRDLWSYRIYCLRKPG